MVGTSRGRPPAGTASKKSTLTDDQHRQHDTPAAGRPASDPALIDARGVMTVAQARAAGIEVAGCWPDRIAMAHRATAFLKALPDPGAPRPAAGIGSDQEDEVRAAWLAMVDQLRQAYSAGYAHARASWGARAVAS